MGVMTDQVRYWLRAAVMLFTIALAANLIGPDIGGLWGYGIAYWTGWIVAALWVGFVVVAFIAVTRWYRAGDARPTTHTAA